MENAMSQEMLDRILKAVIDLRVDMDRKFERVDERFDGVEHRLDKVENRLDKVEHRLGKVEDELGYVKAAVLETGLAVRGHDERLTVLERGK